jgi:response regulator NasT
LRVLIVDPDDARAALVEEGLVDAGPDDQVVARRVRQLELGALSDFKPDAVVIACESPDRDMLEALRESRASERPIVMFVDRSDPRATAEAIEAGVAAYVVDGFSPSRVASVLDVARRRFALMQQLRADLDRAKADLHARKTIERAKGVLMKSRGLDEDAAYKALRKLAMDTGRPLAAVAADVLAVVGLLQGKDEPGKDEP